MALIQNSLIWLTYGVAVALLLFAAAIFVYTYQKPRDRAASITTVSILTITALLATVLLLPVDVALVSSVSSSRLGVRKDWATQDRVDSITFTLKVVYYTLYSLDAVLCLLVCPFTYFFYEEYDERETVEGNQTLLSRLFGALKYTLIFVLLCVVLFLVGFFIPVAANDKGRERKLDYFKDLLSENRKQASSSVCLNPTDHIADGERALTFGLGLLITLGTLIYVLYTGAGLALLPVSLIKSAPAISAPSLAANTESQLEINRERQRQLEGRNAGRTDGLDPRDRRELEQLVREERTLVRRERLAVEAVGEGDHILTKTWNKLGAVFRPVKLIGGFLLFLVAIVISVSMLITSIDKAKNSICKKDCGYLLGHINIFQPINWLLVVSAKMFPIDYIVFLLLFLILFCSSVCGIATIGLRFLWVVLFRIRKGQTSPQALLLATVMLALIVLAINYAVAMVVAPQYAMYGPQTYCDRAVHTPGQSPDCRNDPELIKPCSEIATNPVARTICTPSVASTFINRIMVNFPFFGIVDFWAQFVFLGIFFITAITALFRAPNFDAEGLDAELEEEEEEGLLASTGRRFTATWQDLTGRARKNNPGNYGTASAPEENVA